MRPRLVQPGWPGLRPAAPEPRRFVVLSATMGSGHDAVAAALSDRLTAAGHQVSQADVLDLLPAGLGRVICSFYHATISHAPPCTRGSTRFSSVTARNRARPARRWRPWPPTVCWR
jgi:hypothetical protein